MIVVNMKFYQEFLTVAEAIQLKEEMGETKDLKTRSPVTPEEKAEMKNFYVSLNLDKMLGTLEVSKIFDIDDETKVLLLNTNAPKDTSLLKLPFSSIFIDINITKEEAELDEGISEIKGILVIERDVVEPDGRKAGRVFNVVYRSDCLDEKEQAVYLDEALFAIEDDDTIKFRYSVAPKTAKILQQFVYNFILFMNQPEIERVEVYRTPEQNAKRVARGKRALPEVTTCIRLTGKLKEYVNSVRTQTHMPYSYRFWVRGHFRTLRSDVWRLKKGMKIWIPPFIKGEGMLVDKKYELINKDVELEPEEEEQK
jgi:hypothetical protein